MLYGVLGLELLAWACASRAGLLCKRPTARAIGSQRQQLRAHRDRKKWARHESMNQQPLFRVQSHLQMPAALHIMSGG